MNILQKSQKKWQGNKRLIIGHLISWLGYAIVVSIVLLDFYAFEWAFLIRGFPSLLVSIIVFYVSAFYLTPNYLKQRTLLQHLLYAMVLIFGASALAFSINYYNYTRFLRDQLDMQNWSFFALQLIAQLVFFIFGITYALAVDWINKLKKNSELKNKQLETELKLLKSQLHPHFLFNTLNNIYTLCYLKDDNAAPMVMNLSKMLRYVLYDGQADAVPLKKEVNFLYILIDLQQLKNTEQQSINLHSENIKSQHQIAPLLLLNFFENAFKHGDWDTNNKAWMDAKIKVDAHNTLHFEITNSLNTKKSLPTKLKEQNGGIGLENVQRRLDILYPKKHQLQFAKDDEQGIFTVSLNVDLKEKVSNKK